MIRTAIFFCLFALPATAGELRSSKILPEFASLLTNPFDSRFRDTLELPQETDVARAREVLKKHIEDLRPCLVRDRTDPVKFRQCLLEATAFLQESVWTSAIDSVPPPTCR